MMRKAWRLGVLAVPLLAGACDGRPRASSPNAGDLARQPRTGPTLAVFDLTQGAPEQESGSFLVGTRKQSFHELMREVRTAARETAVKGLYFRFGSTSLGFARATELGDALADLRATKPIYCHAEGYTNATLYAAARACTKIYLSPAGAVDSVGIAAQVVYMRKLLAEKLDLTIDFLQVGKFKGAEEPLTRDGPSDEARESLEGTLADMRATWLDGLSKGRPETASAALEDGPYDAERAKAVKLVDEIAYADDARTAAREASSAVRDEIRFGPGSLSAREGDLSDLVRVLAGENESAPVALVRATGSIAMSSGGGLLGGRSGITEKDLGKLLLRIERDDAIKALVLRIDSPGGSALASDLLWHALMRVRAKKPIVVSVGEMAASGGYYLASTGTEIMAEPTSIVGSIGVVGGKIAVGKALEKIGVHTETFAAKRGDAKAANRAVYESPLVGWDDDTREKVRATMVGIYELFLARVVEGRSGKLAMERLRESAEGRIFSGREGKERGLVDSLGGLGDALARARELARLPEDARVVTLGQRPGFLDAIMGMGGAAGDEGSDERLAAVAAAARPSAIDALGDAFPELAPFVTGLVPLAQGERALAAMPFAIVVK